MSAEGDIRCRTCALRCGAVLEGRTPEDAVNIEQFLRERGFDLPAALVRARKVLEDRGFTHPGKRALSTMKRDDAAAVLASTLLRVCGKPCLQIDRAGDEKAREAVTVSPPSCEIYGGSNNRRAAIACRRRLRRFGIRRVVIVGGAANARLELDRLLAADGLAIRWVDGLSASRSAKDALADRRWAQLVVIWGPTPLRHAVSHLYTEEPPPHLRIVTVPRRGIEALCAEIMRSYR